MAHYLAFTSGNEYVDIPSAISVSGDGVLAEIDFEYKGASNDVICGGTSFSDFWRINNDNQFRISIAGSASNISLNSPLVVGERYMLKLVRSGSSIEVQDSTNTAITPSATLSASPFVIGKIGSFHNGSSNLTMDLYGFKAGAETYNPSLSNGSGNILPTESGSNQGVLTNFPTDGSQWVFYESGGGPSESFIQTASLSSQESFGSPSASVSGVSIQPSSLDSSELFGTTSLITDGVVLEPSSVASSEEVTEPSLGVGLVFINPDSLLSNEVVPEAFLDVLLKELLPPSLAGSFFVGRPSVQGGDKIAIPIVSRKNFKDIRAHLLSLGFEGQVNEVIAKWLLSEGYDGQFNTAFYHYLGNEGYSGSLTDRLGKWKQS